VKTEKKGIGLRPKIQRSPKPRKQGREADIKTEKKQTWRETMRLITGKPSIFLSIRSYFNILLNSYELGENNGNKTFLIFDPFLYEY